MNIENPYAFPTAEGQVDIQSGMTLLDYFAAHAPRKVPLGFKHERPKSPANIDRLVEKDPEKIKQHEEEMRDYYAEDNICRVIQWRYAYAKRMLQERQTIRKR